MSYSFSNHWIDNPDQPKVIPGTLEVAWQSPSNIALVKYWGKRNGQLPVNPSLSMTLKNAGTETRLKATRTDSVKGVVSVNDNPRHAFIPKLDKLYRWMAGGIPLLGELTIAVSTENSFPHSTGIASSASGLSAFALCLLELAETIRGKKVPQNSFIQDASYAARQGSGSACRSVYGGFALWGQSELIKGSSDEFAVPVNDWIHPDMLSLRDAILVVSSIGKSLPSTAGHKTMEDHPFLGARIVQARKNLAELLDALSTNNFEKLCAVAEKEALTLHALLMTASPGVLLLKPATMEAMQRIREARQSGLPLFFTLDAGASVHVMYPGSSAEQVEPFIKEELEPLCEAGRVIYDGCGQGPVKLNNDLPAS